MFFFFFQAEDGIRDVAVTGVQTCALPISHGSRTLNSWPRESWLWHQVIADERHLDRKSTRLNSSHGYISYAVFCLKKKNPEHLRAARVLDARRHRDPDLAPARQVLRHPDP